MLHRLRASFPQLNLASARITSPETPNYNCIAYAAGDTTKWWWPDAYNLNYWPPRAPRVETLPAFQHAFSLLGYQLCADGSLEPAHEKVAIFHRHSSPTHAARQLEHGLWTSKMGQWHDILHTEQCLTSSAEYGDIAFFMRRPRVVLHALT